METYFTRGGDVRSYLPHDDSDFEGRAPKDAETTEIAIENARKTIHRILVEDRRRNRSSALPELAPQLPVDFLEPQPKQVWGSGQDGSLQRGWAAVKAMFGGRIDVRHIFWPVAFALVLWQPTLLLVLLFVTFWLVLIGHMIFGVSRMARLRDMALGLLPARWLP